MSFRDWARNSAERARRQPIHRAVSVSAQKFAEGAGSRLGIEFGSEHTGGTNVFDLPDWDLLIVLDACRPDILRAVSREYAWLDTAGMTTYTSVGGYSLDWLERTFAEAPREAIASTGFAAWNPYTTFTGIDYAEACGAFDAVHEHAWRDDLGCIPPEAVTDAALEMGTDRVLAWYQQPHTPYPTLVDAVETLGEEEIGNEDNGRLTVWNLLRRGEISEYEAVLACAHATRWALDDIERLVEAMPADADVLVTADHGELFDPMGRLGHPRQNYSGEQLQVPLVPVEQARVGEAVTFGDGSARTIDRSVDEQLAALGYTE